MKAGVYVGVLGLVTAGACAALFLARRTNADLEAQVTRLSRQNADLRHELKQASRQAADIGQRAVELDSQLGSTKSRTTATETRNQQLAHELSAREQREVALMAEIAELRQSADLGTTTTRGPDALPSSPPPAASVTDLESFRRRIAELEGQLIKLLTRSLAEMPGPAAQATEPTAARPHQVVRVGAGDTFVVLDYGTEHGASQHAIIRLQRGTSELAQVQISDVRPRFSLAQVLPGTLKGQLQTGDLVVFHQ